MNTNPVVLCEHDYNKLSQYINLKDIKPDDTNTLAYELSRAIVVKDEAFPLNTIRIGSTVTVLDLDTNRENTFTIVLPDEVNAPQKKISIFSPMSAAIIGFRENDEVTWKMPGGTKNLKVIKVENEAVKA